MSSQGQCGVGWPRRGGVAFPVTLWTMVLSAREESMPALTRLCETYQRPIKAFFRSAGCPRDDVDDLAQDFLVHILHPDVLKTVDPDKGRFRSFLLVCLRHYWSQVKAHGRTIKKGGRVIHVPLDTGPDQPGFEVAHTGLRPDQAFDVEWSRTVVQRAVRRLEAEAADPVRQRLVSHLLPVLYAKERIETQAELALQLGMTPGAVRIAIHRIRRRLRQLIIEELAATVGAGADLEKELRELQAILAGN